MTSKEKIKYILQVLFGYQILSFAMIMIYLDCAGIINVEKFGYAFFGGIVIYFMNYFFRKGIKNENTPVV